VTFWSFFAFSIPIALRIWSVIDPSLVCSMLHAGGSPVGLSAVQGLALNLLRPGISPQCFGTSFRVLLGRLAIVFGWVFREF
jgi:hypothetical protein